jgi:hypothetical protein
MGGAKEKQGNNKDRVEINEIGNRKIIMKNQ